MCSTRKKSIVVLALLMMLTLSLLTACGSSSAKDFSSYMQGQPALRSSIDAQLSVLSADAKGSVQYVDNKAIITVNYYTLTQAEIDQLEMQRVMGRCSVIMNEALEQYQKDTGKTATAELAIRGSDAGKEE